MHLVEMLARRAVPAAGVSIGITRRCPLSCAHCSTSSTMQSEQVRAGLFTRFVDSFTATSHPEFMAMSGGEALLRPELVRNLALKARVAGTKSSVLSGLFFARQQGIPKKIKTAIDAVDHFSVSMDVFHEREVPRANVFVVLSQLLDEGKCLSLHIAGESANDPYLDDLVNAVQQKFGKRIPMLVNTLSAFGRAKTFFLHKGSPGKITDTPQASPCSMAAWPVVGFDGVVAACGNDNLIGQVPGHLRLGDIRVDTWADIHSRCVGNAMQLALRTYGPEYLQARFGNSGQKKCTGYCDTCIKLGEEENLQIAVSTHMLNPGPRILGDSVVDLQLELGAVGFARRHSHPRFAELVLLGA